MKSSFLILLIFSFFSAAGQSPYTDSLYQYQYTYKKDLSEIIQSDTAYVRFYTPDPIYRVPAKVEVLKDQPFFGIRTSSGKPRQARKYARVTFVLNNKTYQLFAYQLGELLASKENRDHFFIPFLDEGSGEQNYGGGRYLDFTTHDVVNNTLMIDFNKAYNPYCAFVKGYQCPVPPRENTLAVVVEAGEKAYVKPKQ
jgi:uncharacterized protein